MTNSLLLKMAIEIVDLPIKNGDFPVRYVSLPEGKTEVVWCDEEKLRWPKHSAGSQPKDSHGIFWSAVHEKKTWCLFTETQQLSFQWERWWYSSGILCTPFWDWNPNLFDSTYLNSSWQVCYNVIINAHARTHQKSWLLWLDEIRWELNANGILQQTRVYADRQQEVLLLKFDFKVGAIINRFNTWLLLTALSLFHSSQHHPQGC